MKFTMRYTQAISLRLRDLLRHAKLTQTQFAEITHISRTTINQIATGRVHTVTFECLLKICQALDISLYDFFNCDVFSLDLTNN
jgi:DNA-binding Xre family transcriptional regulator